MRRGIRGEYQCEIQAAKTIMRTRKVSGGTATNRNGRGASAEAGFRARSVTGFFVEAIDDPDVRHILSGAHQARAGRARQPAIIREYLTDGRTFWPVAVQAHY